MPFLNIVYLKSWGNTTEKPRILKLFSTRGFIFKFLVRFLQKDSLFHRN